MSGNGIFYALKKIIRGNSDDDAFELLLRLRSGAEITVALVEMHPLFLEAKEIGEERRHTYVPYDAIDQVTPLWL